MMIANDPGVSDPFQSPVPPPAAGDAPDAGVLRQEGEEPPPHDDGPIPKLVPNDRQTAARVAHEVAITAANSDGRSAPPASEWTNEDLPPRRNDGQWAKVGSGPVRRFEQPPIVVEPLEVTPFLRYVWESLWLDLVNVHVCTEDEAQIIVRKMFPCTYGDENHRGRHSLIIGVLTGQPMTRSGFDMIRNIAVEREATASKARTSASRPTTSPGARAPSNVPSAPATVPALAIKPWYDETSVRVVLAVAVLLMLVIFALASAGQAIKEEQAAIKKNVAGHSLTLTSHDQRIKEVERVVGDFQQARDEAQRTKKIAEGNASLAAENAKLSAGSAETARKAAVSASAQAKVSANRAVDASKAAARATEALQQGAAAFTAMVRANRCEIVSHGTADAQGATTSRWNCGTAAVPIDVTCYGVDVSSLRGCYASSR